MQERWITRSGRKLFRYHYEDGAPVSDKELVAYCKSLRVPPAWQDVRITEDQAAKVLATGIDGAGRLQYIYNPEFRAQQEQLKFERVLRFARALPKMRQTVDEDLKRHKLDYRRVMATIVSIMDRTYIRVGNETYARENHHYGLTTLRSKHTSVHGDTITFDFIGKSGKHSVKQVTDRRLASVVRQLDDLPGYEVLKYYDYAALPENARKGAKPPLKDVKSEDVNAYIKEVMGEEFSAKDFRTWAGTLLASVELATVDCSGGTARDRQKAVTSCVKKVAQKLGNTPAIARSSYIDPRIIKMYMDGDDMRAIRKTIKSMKVTDDEKLSAEERCVLQVLEKNPAA